MDQINELTDTSEYLELIAQYSESIDVNPKDAEAYFKRANTYYLLNKFDKAIADYDKAIEINPNKPVYYFKRANVNAKLKSFLSALADYLRGKELETLTGQ